VALKVLSYNILEGGGDRLPDITAVIGEQNPDVAALLEANSRPNVEILAAGLGMDLVFGEASSDAHVAWLSRLPIRRRQNHRSAALAKTLLEIEVDWNGLALGLFATHLASRWDSQLPEDEVASILALLSQQVQRPHLLVGDFNALGPGDLVGSPPPGVQKRGGALDNAPRPAIQQIHAAGYLDCYRALHPTSPGFTYHTSHPWLRLDYIFASPEIGPNLLACDVVRGQTAQTASDHFPILAEFR
jgi:exodeoxyribonuclease III